MTKYIVKRGDTLSAISVKYSIPIELICKINKIEDPNKIYAGQELIISNQEASNAIIPHIQVLISMVSNVIKDKAWSLFASKLGGSVNAAITGLTETNTMKKISLMLWSIVSSTINIVYPQTKLATMAIDFSLYITDVCNISYEKVCGLINKYVNNAMESLQLKILYFTINNSKSIKQ
eukprot:jgi/Orpsp1_1/1174972/evm.model.c7180000052175.1